MEKDKILEELYAQALFGSKLGLENMKRMCEALGNPEKEYKIIHLAGTNGKGSTATAIEKCLLEAGYKVGKYTSPHILDFNERITFNEKEIRDEDIVKYYLLVKEIWKKLGISPTFFEITTMMMFKYFQDQQADYVVLETGLGGRLDATNVAEADIAVITNVSLDHQEILGNNLYDIAKEKAGIIKEGSSVIVGDSDPEFLRAISEAAVNYINVLEKYKESTYRLNYENFITEIFIDDDQYRFSLFGDHQYKNFLCAYEALKELGVSKEIIKAGMEKVVWQCRFEIFNRNPLVVLDGAHNMDGMRNIKSIIEKNYSRDEVLVITSILKDKEVKEMLKLVSEFAGEIIFTSLAENKRGISGKELSEYIDTKDGDYYIEEDIRKAYETALSKGKKLILICGSFYLLSKLKEEFLYG